MDVEQRYQKIMQELERGGRGLERYSYEEMEFLEQELPRVLDANDFASLEKILCLIDHSSANNPHFEKSLIRALNSDLPDALLVFALNASRKHILAARFQRGLRLEYDFLEALKKLLYSRSPEVVEWTLRTIEECSNQGVYFLREFDNIKPPPWKWFNAHQRAVREIIALLERRWSRFEKPKT
jgi:hypothetical protein